MKCPECDSEIGDPGYKRFKCPQCNSTLVNTTDTGIKEVVKPKKHGVITGIIKRTIRKEGPRELLNIHCVGCGDSVDPATSRTGSIIRGLRYMTQRVNKTTPIERVLLGEITTPWRTYPLQRVTGGQGYSVDRKIAFFERNKGNLCEECAANYHYITDSSGSIHPIVKVDPLPGTIGHRKLAQYDPTEESQIGKQEVSNAVIDGKRVNSLNHWLDVGRR